MLVYLITGNVLISSRTLYTFTGPDLNYQEVSGGGPDLVVRYFPKLEKLLLLLVSSFSYMLPLCCK